MISAIRRSFNVNLRFIDGRSRVTGNRVKYNYIVLGFDTENSDLHNL